MYHFLQSRSRPGGVAKIKYRSLAAVARISFRAPRNAWGSHFLLFHEVPCGALLEPQSGPVLLVATFAFFKTLPAGTSLFLETSSLC